MKGEFDYDDHSAAIGASGPGSTNDGQRWGLPALSVTPPQSSTQDLLHSMAADHTRNRNSAIDRIVGALKRGALVIGKTHVILGVLVGAAGGTGVMADGSDELDCSQVVTTSGRSGVCGSRSAPPAMPPGEFFPAPVPLNETGVELRTNDATPYRLDSPPPRDHAAPPDPAPAAPVPFPATALAIDPKDSRSRPPAGAAGRFETPCRKAFTAGATPADPQYLFVNIAASWGSVNWDGDDWSTIPVQTLTSLVHRVGAKGDDRIRLAFGYAALLFVD